jgi:hypothetical protein
MRYPQTSKQLEGQIKASVKDYLLRTGWHAFPVLQGLGAYKGISDLIAVKDGVQCSLN